MARTIDRVRENIICCEFFRREYILRHILISKDGQKCLDCCSRLVEKLREMLAFYVDEEKAFAEDESLIRICDLLLEQYFMIQSEPMDGFNMDFDQFERLNTQKMLTAGGKIEGSQPATQDTLPEQGFGLTLKKDGDEYEYEEDREYWKYHFGQDSLYPHYVDDDELSTPFIAHVFNFIRKDETFSDLKFLYDKSLEFGVYCTHLGVFCDKKYPNKFFEVEELKEITEPEFAQRKKTSVDANILTYFSRTEFNDFFVAIDILDSFDIEGVAATTAHGISPKKDDLQLKINVSSNFFSSLRLKKKEVTLPEYSHSNIIANIEHVLIINSLSSNFDMPTLMEEIARILITKIVWRKVVFNEDITDDELKCYEKLNPTISKQNLDPNGADMRMVGLSAWDFIYKKGIKQRKAFNTLWDEDKLFWVYKGEDKDDSFRTFSRAYNTAKKSIDLGQICSTKASSKK